MRLAKMTVVDGETDLENAEEVCDDMTTLNKQESSFVRQSTKFWVKPKDLTGLVLSIAEHLNVYTFENDHSPFATIESVYFDNAEKEIYSTRIAKRTGNKLVRFRTYNQNYDQVFVERKVHLDQWTGEESSKDRFAISSDLIMPFLRYQTIPVPDKHIKLRDEISGTSLSQIRLFMHRP